MLGGINLQWKEVLVMGPMRLQPVTRDYLWGGTKLMEDYHKQADSEIVAETWELSAHRDGSATIAEGEGKGESFREYIGRFPGQMGERARGATEFPLLIKLIDARQDLSVQVHPDDAYARRVESSLGKTEMWVVLSREPGSFLYCGFNRPVDREELARRIRENTLTEVLHKVPVSPGDVIFIPAGTIHAIGAGIVLAEVQQNSDVTYRVYDYGRLDKGGSPRPLHVEKALDVIRPAVGVPGVPGAGDVREVEGGKIRRLASCDYFTVWELCLDGTYTGCADSQSFHSLLCTEGEGSLSCAGKTLRCRKGDSLFLPAGCGSYQLSGTGVKLLVTTL